jgi:phosphocarrier protein FPr
MKRWSVVIQNRTGLHARPARVFVDTAKQFASDIRIQFGSKTANGRSLISVLGLGVRQGSEITLVVDGVDEIDASAALEQLVKTGLGEGDSSTEIPAAKTATNIQPKPAPQPSANGVVRGLPAGPGIAVGEVFQFAHSKIKIEEKSKGIEAERKILQSALARSKEQLSELRVKLLSQGADEEAAIFDVHLVILDDPSLTEPIDAAISNGESAAAAWFSILSQQADTVRNLDDPLLAARAADVQDVRDRVLRSMNGNADSQSRIPDHAAIVVARDLTPSDVVTLNRENLLGIVTAEGGPTAHAAIIARALGIPAVVGVGENVLTISSGTTIVLDGERGTIDVSPDNSAISVARAAQDAWNERRFVAAKNANQPAITRDGRKIEVAANVGSMADAREATANGADGIGLLRTEFVFINSSTEPTEQTQFEIYRDIVEVMQGSTVIVRTLDIGGDKPVPYIKVAPEANPFLGERGVRLCLNRPQLFEQQLRAILRAANHGPIRIMLPMVADIREWRNARAMIESIRAEQNAPCVELGIMIEVPSAALMADAFAKEVDFFSIGTNDLTQYTLAMDRQHPILAKQADGLHPAVLRLIAKTVEAAHAAGKWVGVCGELGADAQAVPILIGLGVDELSVNPRAVPLVKAAVRGFDSKSLMSLAQKALACETSDEVRALTKE